MWMTCFQVWLWSSAGERRSRPFFHAVGEGVLHRQLLAIYCVNRAPEAEWLDVLCVASTGTIEGIRMEIGGHKFDAMEFWITPKIDSESEKVDITVWHPLFATVRKESERLSPLFIFSG